MDEVEKRLEILHRQVATQNGRKVDCYYSEGHGALFVEHGYPMHPNYVVLAFPDIAIRQGMA
jgi:hypothetical protein